MNFSLLDNIDTLDDGFLATILSTRGHTYQKTGARALFRRHDPLPSYGNLGSLCADGEIVAMGAEALRAGRPRVLLVDTTSSTDALLGYGTSCGGVMEILIEPLLPEHRAVYRDLRHLLEGGSPVFLVHDTQTGALSITAVEPARSDGTVVERISPPRRVVLFGATPLAACIHAILRHTRFDVHVADWREAHLDRLDHIDATRRHLDSAPLDRETYTVILSHSFERDRAALRRALDAGCAFIGMLSSTARRDQMFEELAAEGVEETALRRVSCPVGLDLPARTDAEIAVGIAAQLLKAEDV